MHIKGSVVLYVSDSPLFPPHSPADQHSLYTLTINTITDHKLLGHVHDWRLLCVWFTLEFMRHTFKPATQHQTHSQDMGKSDQNDLDSWSDIID